MPSFIEFSGRRHGTAWTEDRVKLLEQLWGEGLSCSQIAKRIGAGVSRNAVIGKALRLGLPKRNADANRMSTLRVRKFAPGMPTTKPARNPASVLPPARSPLDRAASDKQNWGWRRFPGGSGASIKPNAAALAVNDNMDDISVDSDVEIPVAERKTLVDLDTNDCRWPIGDPLRADFHFCAQAQVPGQPYCEHHLHRAYQPPQPRRRPAGAVADDHRPADAPSIHHANRAREPV